MAAKTKKASKTDLSSLSEQDILRNIEEAEIRLKRMKFSHAITPIDNPMSIRILRRELAQLKTEQRRKQLES
jgi:large subunit ribosomal protein L29